MTLQYYNAVCTYYFFNLRNDCDFGRVIEEKKLDYTLKKAINVNLVFLRFLAFPFKLQY